MLKIAISGQMRSGKNTLANMLLEEMGLNEQSAKIVALADPIKNILLTMVPKANRECLFGPSELRSKPIGFGLLYKNDLPLTYRQALIDIGKLGRSYNPDIWLNALIQDVELTTDKKAYISCDVRFKNEFYYLKNHNFFTIRIRRPDGPKIDDVSEIEQLSIPDKDFNVIIENSSSLEDLKIKTKELIEKIHIFAF